MLFGSSARRASTRVRAWASLFSAKSRRVNPTTASNRVGDSDCAFSYSARADRQLLPLRVQCPLHGVDVALVGKLLEQRCQFLLGARRIALGEQALHERQPRWRRCGRADERSLRERDRSIGRAFQETQPGEVHLRSGRPRIETYDLRKRRNGFLSVAETAVQLTKCELRRRALRIALHRGLHAGERVLNLSFTRQPFGLGEQRLHVVWLALDDRVDQRMSPGRVLRVVGHGGKPDFGRALCLWVAGQRLQNRRRLAAPPQGSVVIGEPQRRLHRAPRRELLQIRLGLRGSIRRHIERADHPVGQRVLRIDRDRSLEGFLGANRVAGHPTEVREGEVRLHRARIDLDGLFERRLGPSPITLCGTGPPPACCTSSRGSGRA